MSTRHQFGTTVPSAIVDDVSSKDVLTELHENIQVTTVEVA